MIYYSEIVPITIYFLNSQECRNVSNYPYSVNELLSGLVVGNQIKNPSKDEIIPLHQFHVEVKDHEVKASFVTLRGSDTMVFSEDNVKTLLRNHNTYFFDYLLTDLKNTFHSFKLKLYFGTDWKLIYDEHSYLTGRLYFKVSPLDKSDFWEKMDYVQTEVPQILRQKDSDLCFHINQGKINFLEYKYYYSDIHTYPYVPKNVKEHNNATFAQMYSLAKTMEYGVIRVEKKDTKGRINEISADTTIKYGEGDM